MSPSPRAVSRARRAFSLVELFLVVILIMALVGVAVPFFQDNLSEAQGTKAGQDLEVIKKAWSLRQAREPVTRRSGDIRGLEGEYMQEIPLDPWGREYIYDPATNTLRSNGADGTPGGSGGDTDVVVRLGTMDGATWLGQKSVPAALAPGAEGSDPLEAEFEALLPAEPPAPIPARDFIETAHDRFSTFGLDVDTGSYTLARRLLREGRLPPAKVVRTEEFVNVLRPSLAPPTDADFAVHTEVEPGVPGEPLLLRVALRAREARAEERERLSLTFVVDVSGSMSGLLRLPLVQWSLTRLSESLRPTDRVALVTFSNGTRVVHPMAPLGSGDAFRAAVASLRTGGATDVGTGLTAGYQVAIDDPDRGGTRRVVLCSDGAANTGVRDAQGLLETVHAYARDGILLTTLGFGMDGYRDDLMEELADRGDGAYAYLDSREEAEKVLVEELTGTFLNVARDARIQVEFDPDRILRYRLLGYENREIADEDFRSATVDAGEVGPGHGVTALYEIVLADAPAPGPQVGVVRLRWKTSDGQITRELEVPVTRPGEEGAITQAMRRSALAAEFAEALRTREGRTSRLMLLTGKSRQLLETAPEDLELVELDELIRSAARLAGADLNP